MESENIFTEWFLWQFWEMPKFLFSVWKNFMGFAANFFSVGMLLKTLFSPWRKYKWVYPKSFDPMEIFGTFVSNLFSRLLGAILRIVLIFIGFIFQIFVATAGMAVFVFWLAVPFIIISGFLFVFSF